MPTRSMTRADSIISSSGSIVSCITPIRNGGGIERSSQRGVASTAMAVEIEIDVATLKSEIKKTYARVSTKPEEDFIFPTGRAWAEELDYPGELAGVPELAAESFAGVAHPLTLCRLE